MSTKQRREPVLTLGDFIVQVYDACEERAAIILWYAINSDLVMLPQRRPRYPGQRKRAMGSLPATAAMRPLLRTSSPLPKGRPHVKLPPSRAIPLAMR